MPHRALEEQSVHLTSFVWLTRIAAFCRHASLASPLSAPGMQFCPGSFRHHSNSVPVTEDVIKEEGALIDSQSRAMTRSFQDYQKEKQEREWKEKVQSRKEAMNNAQRVSRATEFKTIGNDKFKSGNLLEARDYYREAVIYAGSLAPDPSSLQAKAHFRRAVARRVLGKAEEARDDLQTVLKMQPDHAEVQKELAAVRAILSDRAKQAKEAWGGFLQRPAGDLGLQKNVGVGCSSDESFVGLLARDSARATLQGEERDRKAQEKRQKAAERRQERLRRAEERQQMQASGLACAQLPRKNGPAAAVLGTLAALIAAALKSADFLPGYVKPSIDHVGHHHFYEFSFWALAAGVLAACLTLVFWRSQYSVFLDKVCINQVDDQLKAEGILSIGGFLRSSKSLLVLWDPTYVQRLWCVFEYAAFVKSHEDQNNMLLKIRPTFLGPCTLAIAFGSMVVMITELVIHTFFDYHGLLAFAGVGVVGFFFGTAAFQTLGRVTSLFNRIQQSSPRAAAAFTSPWCCRNYYGSVRQLQVELANFKLDETKCTCCEMGHEEEEELQCDRQVVMECVHRWFGSVENFEKVVCTTVFDGLTSQLGQYSFPYRWLLGATTPILWAQLDMVAARFKAGDNHGGVVAFILALAACLIYFHAKQDAFEKLSKGKMLYEAREREMEPVRKKELEKTQTLELEQKLLNIIDDAWTLLISGFSIVPMPRPKTEKLEDFMKQREARAWDQSAELDQKKKVLEKVKKEEQWSQDDAWRDQRLEHRKQIQARGQAQTPQMWEAKQVDRWCQQRLRDLLVPLTVQAESPLPSELSAVLEDTKGLGQRSVL
eukprot:s815_g10.t1